MDPNSQKVTSSNQHNVSQGPPVTDRLANFIANLDFEKIPERALHNAKLHILDTLGVALAAVSSPVAGLAFDYCKSTGGPPQSSVWGTSLKTSPPMAAFADGLLAHALDFDDWDAVVHVGHPSSVVLSAAAVLGEARHATGKDLLKAYIVGIETASQIASGCPDLHPRGFHSTPVYGSIGAMAAAASITQLDAEKIKAACGIAASGAGGIHRQQGSMVKPFHAGNAARNGVEAVLLAERGFTADAAIIENPRGFCDTFFGAGNCDYQKMIEGLGNPYFFEAPGLGLKLHPCSAPQFLAADATLHLMRQHRLRYPDVTKVEVRIPPLRYKRHYHPAIRSGLQAKFAVNYVAAICVLDGKLEVDSFSDIKANALDVQEALKKIEVIVDNSIPEPGKYCPVTIELTNGTRVSHTATIAKGHPRNPLTENEVLDKFRSNVRNSISPRRSTELINCVSKLEQVPDTVELTGLLGPG
ncbi:MAG: MmgE/PrpD family protein [Candidatus Binatia bacterium]